MTNGMASVLRCYEQPRQVPNMDVRAIEAIMRGVRPKEVAAVYGVSVRTAYRWRRELVAVEVVQVDGWAATFARRRRKPPVRISSWMRVETSWTTLEDKPLSRMETVSDNRGVEPAEYRRLR